MQYLIYIFNALNVSMIVGVILLHAYAFYNSTSRGAGILPLHVVAVSLSQILFIVLGTSAALRYVDEPFNWRTITFVVASTLTTLSLIIIGEFQRQKLLKK